ncbi:MAG: GDP-mannose dehydrogenase [Candidatus Bathyarchaeota archaeon]|nr:GDP-mannose dehydrogenase [Candidatus Bathyarchaeota archaeon]
MVRDKVLVVGLGEVGRPLFELLKESDKFEVNGYDLNLNKMQEIGQSSLLPSKVDVMHICIPCTDKEGFVNNVVSYVERFSPKLVIINSTVAPGTTMTVYERINGSCLVANSPIRGVHKSSEYMKWELKRWTKYVGGVNAESAKAAKEHFEKLGLKTKVLKGCLETELAKLFETIYRAWMIACFQEMHRISRHFGADFDDVVDFIEDTHRVRLDRPIMFPDVIGGHCLIPNTNLLLKQYDSEFLRLILKSNEKRKTEMTDEAVRWEVDKIKKRVENLEKELYQKAVT